MEAPARPPAPLTADATEAWLAEMSAMPAAPAPAPAPEQPAHEGVVSHAYLNPPGLPRTSGLKMQRLSYSHMAMAEVMMANPTITNNQLAAMFDRSPTWISVVKSSDAFKTFYARRYAELADPELTASIKDRFQAMTEQGLRVLQEKLNKPAAEVSDNLALRAVELGAKALAVGGNAPPPPPPSAEQYLPELTERLLRLGANVRRQVAVDANIVGEG